MIEITESGKGLLLLFSPKGLREEFFSFIRNKFKCFLYGEDGIEVRGDVDRMEMMVLVEEFISFKGLEGERIRLD